MDLISNPFKKHPVDLCCSSDELRPFMNYIYFIKGIAYATDAYALVALSLKDIDADKALMECLEGYKMKREDMQFMNGYEYLFPKADGTIVLNLDGTRQLVLCKINFDDAEKKYQTIIDICEKAKAEVKTKSTSISKIKMRLSLIERIGKAVGFSNSVRFNFMKEPDRVFLEFGNYKNSFALVMPMMDDGE